MTRELKGIIPPLTTPFKADGSLYEEGLRRLVDFQVEKGSHGLFICGTYGSGPLMSSAERKRVHEIVAEQGRDRITIVAHVGAASTAEAVDLAQHAESIGIPYVASISPFYYKHDDRTVQAYFEALVEAVKVPVYVYNNPRAVHVTVTPSLLQRLAEIGVAGIKDSGFNYIDFTHLVLAMGDYPDFRFVVGTEGIALAALMAGAVGCVAGLANAFPEIMVKLWDLFVAGRYEEAAKLQLKANRARQALHIPSSTNAACYTALKARGVDAGYPRAPVLAVEKDKGEAMIAAFKELGLL
ncbi:MAG: dihydrodipicolinate synthase family protein [Chloroflexi bacterium]|jgi:dihydrodipicolinate synthase/N-acetylneuraminate lyase|nr:dihydrodipicolinate synthase family protein [Chloroflexota bacterium]